MKLDCLSGDTLKDPVIRIFEFTTAEAAELMDCVNDLANERTPQLQLHSLPCVLVLGTCELTMRVTRHDQGILEIGPSKFECGFTAGTWENVAGLVEPFANGATGFQWLADLPGEARLLLSANGKW
jgi:hypothetical protein